MSNKKMTMEELIEEILVPQEEQPYEIPESWVWLKFKDVFEAVSNPNGAIKLKDYNDEGKYPIVDQSAIEIGGYTDSEELIYNGELPVIVFGDHTRNVKWIDFIFAQGADGTKLLNTKLTPINKYYYYFLKQISLPDKGYSRHYKFLKESIIPIAPLNEQDRIIHRIENLFKKIDEANHLILEAKATFKLRRAAIIKNIIDSSIEKVSSDKLNYNELKDVYKIFGGGTPSKAKKEYWRGNVNWFSAKDIKSTYLDNSIDKITELGVENSSAKMADKGSIVIVVRSGILSHSLPVAKLMVSATVNQDLKVFSSDNQLLNDFLLWYVQANEKYLLNEYSKSGTTVNSIEFERFKTLKIPILSDELLKKLLFDIEKAIIKEEASYDYLNLEEDINSLKQSILSKAFRGELDTNDPTDISAIELIKSILKEKL